MALHGVRLVALGLWRFGIGAVSLQKMFFAVSLNVLLIILVLGCDVLDDFSLRPIIL